jgi:ABC-type polysaccharide/polyol phosphate export permease
VVNNVIVLMVIAVTGLTVGWRIRTSVFEGLAAFLLLLLFAYAISWIMAWVGLLVPSPEVVNNAAFMIIFPLTFIANTFVEVETLPGPLRVFAEWNPVSSVTQAARELFGNIPEGTPEPTGWPMQHAILYTVLWSVAIIAIFVPLSNRQYRRAISR